MKPLPRNERERLELSLGRLLSNVRELVRGLDETDDLQWKKPQASSDMTPTGYTDPTGATVVDHRRLRLRGVRRDIMREIEAWEVASLRLLNRLNSAVEPYEGENHGDV